MHVVGHRGQMERTDYTWGELTKETAMVFVIGLARSQANTPLVALGRDTGSTFSEAHCAGLAATSQL